MFSFLSHFLCSFFGSYILLYIFLLTHIRGIRPENEIQKWRTLEKRAGGI